MKDLILITSRLVMLFLQVYFRLMKASRISYKAYLNHKTKFEDHCKIGEKTLIAGAKIGRGTYILPLGNFTNAWIGRFCSIGRNVRIIDGFHPVHEWISTHPAFYSPNKQSGFTFCKKSLFEEHRLFDKEKNISILIGHDVWIGNNVSLFSGIKIGNGAVIAAGAVVTKDVEPYSIVGGVPAKKIGIRFEKNISDYIESTRWWNWPMNVLRNKALLFSNVEKFINETKNQIISQECT